MSSKAEPWILGINTSHHNGSMCLLKGTQIIVAIQEERLTRNKRDALRKPRPLALNYCLEYAGISESDLALIVGCGLASQQKAAEQIREMNLGTPVITISHHLAHAIGGFATSGFSEAAILVVDGAGSADNDLDENELRIVKRASVPNHFRWLEIISLYRASSTDTDIVCLEKHLGDWLAKVPDQIMPRFGSLGSLYDAAAEVIFRDYTSVGKVMGLAPFGEAKIQRCEFFNINDGHFIFRNIGAERFTSLEPWPMNQPEHKILAASVQSALEEALIYLVRHLKKLCPSDNLVYSGGVALNSVANERIVRESGFQSVYFMPASEDSGNAIGAAYYGLWKLSKQNIGKQLAQDALGKEYSSSEINAAIIRTPAVSVCQSSNLISTAADLLAEGKIVGWFQGRSEMGPRALGQRSILCDPRRSNGKDYLNSKVKYREAFRPFAPVILLEEVNNWFEMDGVNSDCPFMLRVCQFRDDKKSLVPAVVHVDGTGRVQTVNKAKNGKYYDLVHAFFKKTGVPILLNTSFNVMGEPIVETPDDALWGLLYTGIDYCFLEDQIVTKEESYCSILDLYPYISALGYEFMTPVFGEQFKVNSLDNSESILFFVKNQWGNFKSIVDYKLFPLLKLVDGTKTGWELLDKLENDKGELNEMSFIQMLGLLRRRSILNFRSMALNSI